MGRYLYENTTTLFPREDASHGEVARDLLIATMRENPHLKNARWSMELGYRSESGRGSVTIKAVDRNAPSPVVIERGRLFAIILVAVLIGMIIEWVWS